VSFGSITLCVASQRVFSVVSEYFVIDSVRKLLDTLSYYCNAQCHSPIGQENVVLCADWSKNRHILPGRLHYGLLYVSFDVCLVVVWWV
jgi:hypothetical protein